MALARSTPHPGTWTYADLAALPDDGKRREIIDGALFEMPAPTTKHGAAIINLIALLLPFVRALDGKLHTAPTDVFFPGANPVEPDLLVLLPGSATYRSLRGIEGIPDLIVEVLSPSNREHDIETKRNLYELAGLREYWLVDAEAETIEVLALVEGRYRRLGVFRGAAAVASAVLPGVAFAAAEAFAGFDDIRPAPEPA